VPALTVTVKLVVPLAATVEPFSVYEICTPLAGFVEFTVSVYVVGGGGVGVPPPPQDDAARHSPAAKHHETSLQTRFIKSPLPPDFALTGDRSRSVRTRGRSIQEVRIILHAAAQRWHPGKSLL
jgi:hypothetical protein